MADSLPNTSLALRRPFLDMPALEVVALPIKALKPNRRNARRHSPAQIKKIATSISAFGFAAPIIIGSGNTVLAGHARLEAAKLLGRAMVPTISLAHLSEAEQRGYMLADNKLAELASWDDAILKLELVDLSALDLDFSVADLGFDTADLNRIVYAPDLEEADAVEDVAPAVQEIAVTRPGDVWDMDRHRLICGDSRDPNTFDALMPEGEVARMMVADAPYNVPVRGHVTKRDADRREFAMAVGEMTPAEFTAFLALTLGNAAARLVKGAITYVFMDWRHITEVMTAGTEAIGPLKNLVVWSKANAGLGAFYRSRHELVFVFKVPGAAHVNTFGMGENGRYRTNVWEYPGAAGFHADRNADLAAHVTPKPVAMIADAILDVSHVGEIVIDPFGGSGSTLIAAHKTDRIARLVELDCLYCDVIVRRYLAQGGTAVRQSDGVAFATAEANALAAAGIAEDMPTALLIEGPPPT